MEDILKLTVTFLFGFGFGMAFTGWRFSRKIEAILSSVKRLREYDQSLRNIKGD